MGNHTSRVRFAERLRLGPGLEVSIAAPHYAAPKGMEVRTDRSTVVVPNQPRTTAVPLARCARATRASSACPHCRCRVRQGEVLARLDAQDYRNKLRLAESDIVAAQAVLTEAEAAEGAVASPGKTPHDVGQLRGSAQELALGRSQARRRQDCHGDGQGPARLRRAARQRRRRRHGPSAPGRAQVVNMHQKQQARRQCIPGPTCISAASGLNGLAPVRFQVNVTPVDWASSRGSRERTVTGRPSRISTQRASTSSSRRCMASTE